jgi:hypothetical protein
LRDYRPEMPNYQFKRFRRTGGPESTTGELLSCQVIEAPGLAHVEKMLGPDLRKIDFRIDFAIIEGDTGFVSIWLTDHPKPSLQLPAYSS